MAGRYAWQIAGRSDARAREKKKRRKESDEDGSDESGGSVQPVGVSSA
jgi:hypothetical protein